MENYTLSDIRSVVDGDDGMFGGNGGIWLLIILFFIMFGGGMWGGNRGPVEANAFSDLERDTLNGAATTQSKILETSCATQKAVLDSQYATLLGFKDAQYQMSNCCCDIKNAIHAEGEATRGLIQANTIQELRDRLAVANDAITTQTVSANVINAVRPFPVPAYITCSPYVNTYNNCGCGSFTAF